MQRQIFLISSRGLLRGPGQGWPETPPSALSPRIPDPHKKTLENYPSEAPSPFPEDGVESRAGVFVNRLDSDKQLLASVGDAELFKKIYEKGLEKVTATPCGTWSSLRGRGFASSGQIPKAPSHDGFAGVTLGGLHPGPAWFTGVSPQTRRLRWATAHYRGRKVLHR